jgi:hypothetical protein
MLEYAVSKIMFVSGVAKGLVNEAMGGDTRILAETEVRTLYYLPLIHHRAQILLQPVKKMINPN